MLVGMGMVLFGFVPGFPTGILMVMGLLMIFIGYVISMIEDKKDNVLTRFLNLRTCKKQKLMKMYQLLKDKKKSMAVPDENQTIENIMKLEVLELKLGIRLLQLVQGNSELLDKIKAIRKKIASELGFIIPQIRISDDANLEQMNINYI